MHSIHRLLIGVDPGQSTGLAWLVDDNIFTSIDLPAIEACDKIEWIIQQHQKYPAVIAVERYNITQRTVKLTRQYDALEIIGVCRWQAHRYRIPFLLQAAGEAQRVGNREVLRALGWWKPGGDHLNKAAAQVAMAYQQTFPHEFTKRLELGMIV